MALLRRSWFRPHAYGLGCTPSTWEGWTMTGGLIAGVIGLQRSALAVQDKRAASVALIVAVLSVAWTRTEGGWRWRWRDHG